MIAESEKLLTISNTEKDEKIASLQKELEAKSTEMVAAKADREKLAHLAERLKGGLLSY